MWNRDFALGAVLYENGKTLEVMWILKYELRNQYPGLLLNFEDKIYVCKLGRVVTTQIWLLGLCHGIVSLECSYMCMFIILIVKRFDMTNDVCSVEIKCMFDLFSEEGYFGNLTRWWNFVEIMI